MSAPRFGRLTLRNCAEKAHSSALLSLSNVRDKPPCQSSAQEGRWVPACCAAGCAFGCAAGSAAGSASGSAAEGTAAVRDSFRFEGTAADVSPIAAPCSVFGCVFILGWLSSGGVLSLTLDGSLNSPSPALRLASTEA